MSCPACGRDNRVDALFCKGCGARLALAYPSCGVELDADGPFCAPCGAHLTRPGPGYLPLVAPPSLREKGELE